MNKKTHLNNIISEFEIWWKTDPHSSNMDFYKNIITYTNLNSLNDIAFMKFFYDFVSDGGRIQSGGNRTKNNFQKNISQNLKNYRQFILKPFKNDFDLEEWFIELNNYSGFGVGIATIFLNRIDYKKHPIMNNKTLNALNKLGYKISSSKNYTNYKLVKNHQDKLIEEYPNLKNYYKADALNHYLVAVYDGKQMIADYMQFEIFEDKIEQNEIEVKTKTDPINKEDLLSKIQNNEKKESEQVIIKQKKYKRHNYLMVLIKKYRDYKCQFCSTQILKKNGDYYIEACHINPKAKKGRDSLDNILILCPNCHKLFDYGKRENENHTKEFYSVTLNGKKYKADLE